MLTGFERSTAPAAMVIPADDDYNAARIDAIFEEFTHGSEIVCGSRFMRGGCMKVAGGLRRRSFASRFALYHAARLPTHDPSNGLRLFSRRVLDTIPIESTVGFAYSLELLVKSHRLGWKIDESPLHWYERKPGQSRFRVMKWLPQYLKWFGYAFATTYLVPRPETVKLVLPRLANREATQGLPPVNSWDPAATRWNARLMNCDERQRQTLSRDRRDRFHRPRAGSRAVTCRREGAHP